MVEVINFNPLTRQRSLIKKMSGCAHSKESYVPASQYKNFGVKLCTTVKKFKYILSL